MLLCVIYALPTPKSLKYDISMEPNQKLVKYAINIMFVKKGGKICHLCGKYPKR